MGLMSFLGKYSGVKGGQVGSGIMNIIVKWDPEGATEADIQVMSQELDNITHQRQEALKAFEKEKEEATQAEAKYNRELKVAEVLERQLGEAKTDGNAERIASLETSLTKKVGELEAMRPEVDREVKEAKDAEEYLKTWEEAAELLAKKIVTARQTAKAAQQRMATADLKLKLEKDKQAQAEILAGIRSETTRLGSAVAAMEARAAGLEGKAEEAAFKTRELTKAAAAPTGEEEDVNIIAARQEAEGTQAAPQSVSERLAALKRTA